LDILLVILSAAKDLCTQQVRSFAALRMTRERSLHPLMGNLLSTRLQLREDG